MVTVLRIGHRINRDKRISSHLVLVARAFGAKNIVITGDYDTSLIETVKNVTTEWGGNFKIDIYPYENWKTLLLNWKETGKILFHLTMYGINLADFKNTISFQNIQQDPKLLDEVIIIVGGKKVPGKVFYLADYNIAITNQPHSEVSALAIFLEHLIPKVFTLEFPGGKRVVEPSIEGKKGYVKR
ncbi:tRNA (cytidine(56)-2'-O)-methyltransferase [Candidatus Hodarchaeum mangrovi]